MHWRAKLYRAYRLVYVNINFQENFKNNFCYLHDCVNIKERNNWAS